MTAASSKPPFSGREVPTYGKEPVVILQIYVEGWTSAKRETLQRISFKEKATAALVQERIVFLSHIIMLNRSL